VNTTSVTSAPATTVPSASASAVIYVTAMTKVRR